MPKNQPVQNYMWRKIYYHPQRANPFFGLMWQRSFFRIYKLLPFRRDVAMPLSDTGPQRHINAILN